MSASEQNAEQAAAATQPASSAQRYPAYRFHKNGEQKVVHDPHEDKALGPEWADTPAKWAAPATPAPVPEPQKTTKR